MQIVELKYLEKPPLDTEALVARAQELLSMCRFERSNIDLRNEGNTVLMFHLDTVVNFSEGSIPAQTVIVDTAPEQRDYTEEVQQSWDCEDAKELVEACAASGRLISEFMSSILKPDDRVRLFHGVLQATVELTKPHALIFKHSSKVVDPKKYLDTWDLDPIQRPGSLNVRFFRIEDSDTEDMLMDTRGLHEIGLHDLQCHFRDLDPNEVSRKLYNLGYYIFQNGPVIESGHTIQGLTQDSKWKCQFEESMLEPKRTVLDLNPGKKFAAGNRGASDQGKGVFAKISKLWRGGPQ